MLIRKETASDIDAIFQGTQEAFQNHPYSQGTEPFIVNALRAAKALTISLVCEIEGKVAGHIAFSPATLSESNGGWYLLGPISVLPKCQKQGIGKALIREGLKLLQSMNAKGCVLVGDPGYYQRFGFKSFPGLDFEGVPHENVMGLPLKNEEPRSQIGHHPAFTAKN